METKFDMNQWRYIKDKLRNMYPELSDSDLNWGRVSREDLLQNISTKLGKTKKDLIDVIDSFDYSS
ncbi:hypothetical protein [Maribellus sp. YY47]|uniref:hypothetical protein n=1 Tax=Maribellus sp. YY47 TaxID=2929486 RepID=UPI002001A75A|nr:hypothetical protein [Maribellus sp. YY47]MCK3684936.1 hypothetical protein [Maribellus sp. YY47]